MPLKTPIALIIFKRPDLTQRVFEEIRKAQPQQLLVIADGPKCPEQEQACQETRAIIDTVDWDCTVLKQYSDKNLGCGLNPSQGITWVFEQVEEAIIFEDDCLPHPTFFPFCEELLARYRDDERIMAISGVNCLGNWKTDLQSYHFSYLGGNWGWASWRRAWKYFDYDMRLLPQALNANFIENIFSEESDRIYWQNLFQKYSTLKNDLQVWDYQWLFTRWVQHGLSVIPSINLVSNLGFRTDATHTKDSYNPLGSLVQEAIEFPLSHPPFIVPDLGLDGSIQKEFINPHRPQKGLKYLARTMLKKANIGIS